MDEYKHAATTLTAKEALKLTKKAEKYQAKQLSAARKAEAIRKEAASASPKKRAQLLRKAEKQEIKANAKKVRARQLSERASGNINDKEWKRMGKSRRNHWVYDRLSSVITAFRPKNPLREEGMTFRQGELSFQNAGRIFLGGTKAMNKFVDSDGKEWLCKEAVTCVGTAKPLGALVTEAASRLQKYIDPKTAVDSFSYRDSKGRVCGSLQQRLDIPKDSFDLFKWQTDTSQPLPEGLAAQILREHVTDWLLCNFDTKGENFLIDASGQLRGIDKEQAFSYLDKKETQRMSYTYSPNPNKTLYNTIFEMYANGEIDLDLEGVKQYVDAAMAIPEEEYRETFRDVALQMAGGNKKEAQKISDKILARRNGLQAEYERFFGELAVARGENELVDPDGRFQFGGKALTGDTEKVTAPTVEGKTEARRKISLTELGVTLNKRQVVPKEKEASLPQKEIEEIEL